jgi:HSP20 family protein
MDRLFEDFEQGFSLWPATRPLREAGYSPRVDITESDTEVTVTAELPGMDDDDIRLTLTHNALTLEGEKQAKQESTEKDYYRMERTYGRFRRTIPLPCEVEEDQVSATFKKGVLTVHLPKGPEARREQRHIEVKSG